MRQPRQFPQRYAEVDTVDTESASSNRPELAEFLGFGPVLAGMRRLENKKASGRAQLVGALAAKWGIDDGKEPARL